jgi:Transglutaminase-like superfamily
MSAVLKIPRLFFVAGRKFISQPSEALLLCRMAWWVCFLSGSARWLPLPRALELVSGGEPPQPSGNNTEVSKRLARSIDLLLSADVLFFKPICWKRAAVLRRYLSQNGIATRILFGVKNEAQGKVTGHAWLEANGEPIFEKAPPDYVVTYTFPSDQDYQPQLAVLSTE